MHKKEYGIALMQFDKLRPADAVILAVAIRNMSMGAGRWSMRLLKDGSGVVLDVKSKLDRSQKPEGIDLWRL